MIIHCFIGISLLNSPLFVATNAPFSDSPAFGLWEDTQQAPFSVVLGRVPLLGNLAFPCFSHVGSRAPDTDGGGKGYHHRCAENQPTALH